VQPGRFCARGPAPPSSLGGTVESQLAAHGGTSPNKERRI
jgi:hypothetical protein